MMAYHPAVVGLKVLFAAIELENNPDLQFPNLSAENLGRLKSVNITDKGRDMYRLVNLVGMDDAIKMTIDQGVEPKYVLAELAAQPTTKKGVNRGKRQ